MNRNFFQEDLVKIDFSAANKEDCLAKIAVTFREAGVIQDEEKFFRKMLEREKTLSTGIGHGIAIPHMRHEDISELKVGLYLLDKEIDFDSLDRKGVRIIITFAIPQEGGNEYMKVLKKISEYLRNEDNRNNVFGCRDADQLLKVFRRLVDDE